MELYRVELNLQPLPRGHFWTFTDIISISNELTDILPYNIFIILKVKMGKNEPPYIYIYAVNIVVFVNLFFAYLIQDKPQMYFISKSKNAPVFYP